MKNTTQYYRQMGNLLYCIAAVDGSIAPKEWKELRRLVKEDLAPVEDSVDEFGTDEAFDVEFQFDMLEGNNVPAEQAWEEFSDYLETNKSKLPEVDRNRFLNCAEKVASSFHGISKAEHDMLARLRKKLSLTSLN
jgi:hypothetical protein